MVPPSRSWLYCWSIIGLSLMPTLNTHTARAEIAPRAVNGGIGMLTLNTYTTRYKPSTSSYLATGAGLDVGVSPRWALSMNTVMTSNEGLVGYAIGTRLAFGPRRRLDSGGTEGLLQYTTTSVPRWHFDIFGGVARYRFSQTLTSSDTSIVKSLRSVPVKADLLGFSFSPSVSWAYDENWAIQAQYAYHYGVAAGFNIVGHGLLTGINYSF